MAINQNKKTYIVFQGGHYKEEYACGYFFAPYLADSGMSIHHWGRLTELKPGDKVFHYNKGFIRAISTVTSTWFDWDRPMKNRNEEWEQNGRRVDCDPVFLDEPIKVSDYKEDIIKYRNEKYSAFNKNGEANQGYLYELEPELAAIFEKEAERSMEISIGDVLTNSKISKAFGVGNMGGMRKSNANNCLVIISDHTKGLYEDRC